MIVDPERAAVSVPEGPGSRASDLFLEAAGEHRASFIFVAIGGGLELAVSAPGSVSAARSFMKVCSVRPAHTLVFFFKRSLLPFSRDRLAYGGAEWPDDRLDPAHARAALDFLASGLSPAARPPWLRRALPFDIPE